MLSTGQGIVSAASAAAVTRTARISSSAARRTPCPAAAEYTCPAKVMTPQKRTRVSCRTTAATSAAVTGPGSVPRRPVPESTSHSSPRSQSARWHA